MKQPKVSHLRGVIQCMMVLVFCATEGWSQEFSEGIINANGLRFAYIEKGEGPLVLMLHGFPDIPQTFRHQMEALSEAGFRVVAPYMRGYAPSDTAPNGMYHSAALAQDVVGLIEAFHQDSVTIIGHDWGASAAYGAAILVPQKISALITIAVPRGDVWWDSFIMNPQQQRRSWYMFFFQLPYAEEAVAYNDFAFIEYLWRDWSPGWKNPPEHLEAVKQTFRKPGVLTAALSYYRHSLGSVPLDSGLTSIRKRLGEPINVPTLYMHGANDGGIGVENVEGMEALGLRQTAGKTPTLP